MLGGELARRTQPSSSSPSSTVALSGSSSSTPADYGSVDAPQPSCSHFPSGSCAPSSARVAGVIHESAQVLLPRFVRRSRLYEATAKNLLRISIELVGGVEAAAPQRPSRRLRPRSWRVRKGAGNVVELGSIAAFGFSPLWLLAAPATWRTARGCTCRR